MITRIKYWSNWLLNLPFVLINSKQCLKSDNVTRFPPIFAQKTLPGPHMNMQNWFREIFRFRKDILYQSSKFTGSRTFFECSKAC